MTRVVSIDIVDDVGRINNFLFKNGVRINNRVEKGFYLANFAGETWLTIDPLFQGSFHFMRPIVKLIYCRLYQTCRSYTSLVASNKSCEIN